MWLFYLLDTFVFFTAIYGANLRVEPVDKMVVLSSRDNLPSSVTLSCQLHSAPPLSKLVAQWKTQNGNGTETISIGVLRDNYDARLPIEGLMELGVSGLSYEHGGKYTCRARDRSEMSFQSATITLSLELELEVIPKIVIVDNKTKSVEMKCEMSQYIEPDENLQWFKNGQKINPSNKYKVRFEDGNSPSLINGVRTQSRVSVLVVSDFQEQNDSGCYYCETRSTQKSASVFVGTEEPDPTSCQEPLSVETPGQVNPTPLTSSPTTPTSNPTTPEGGQENGGGGGGPLEGVPVVTTAVAGSCAGLVLIFLAVLLIMMCYICFGRSKHRTAATENNYSADAITSITLQNDFSPPLPPRPILMRSSHISDYYMNEGMDPEKPYTSIPPYTSMASYPVHQHLQLPVANTSYSHLPHHAYDTVLDCNDNKADSVHNPNDPTHFREENVATGHIGNEENVSTQNEYIQICRDGKTESHEYINVHPTEDSKDRSSDDEYVPIPDSTQESAQNEYYSVPTEDDRDDPDTTSALPDGPKANVDGTAVQFSTYDRHSIL